MAFCIASAYYSSWVIWNNKSIQSIITIFYFTSNEFASAITEIMPLVLKLVF